MFSASCEVKKEFFSVSISNYEVKMKYILEYISKLSVFLGIFSYSETNTISLFSLFSFYIVGSHTSWQFVYLRVKFKQSIFIPIVSFAGSLKTSNIFFSVFFYISTLFWYAYRKFHNFSSFTCLLANCLFWRLVEDYCMNR